MCYLAQRRFVLFGPASRKYTYDLEKKITYWKSFTALLSLTLCGSRRTKRNIFWKTPYTASMLQMYVLVRIEEVHLRFSIDEN